MSRTTTLLALASATSLLLAFQDAPAPSGGGLAPVAAEPEAEQAVTVLPAHTPGLAAQQAADWRAGLTAEDFASRAASMEFAIAAARADADLRASLEAWSADRTNGELAWTAFLILRAVAEQQHVGSPFAPGPAPFQWGPGDIWIDPSSLDPPPNWIGPGRVWPPTIPSPLTPTTPRLGGPIWGDADPFGLGGPFDGQFWPQSPSISVTPGAEGTSQSLEIGPDGVKLRIERSGPDGTEIEEYEANDLDELRTNHPELFEAGGPLEGAASDAVPQQPFDLEAQLQADLERQLEDWLKEGSFPGGFEAPNVQVDRLPIPALEELFEQLLPRPSGAPPLPEAAPVPEPDPEPEVGGPVSRTDVLGVMVAQDPVSVEGDSSGVAVESVVAGTIAAHVGLTRGDLVIALNGERIRTRDDIARVLGEWFHEDPVSIRWIGIDGVLDSGRWIPVEH